MAKYGNYWSYSIGCVIVWAVVLTLRLLLGSSSSTHTILLIFGGWCIGWVSATIARSVYPPPKHRLGRST